MSLFGNHNRTWGVGEGLEHLSHPDALQLCEWLNGFCLFTINNAIFFFLYVLYWCLGNIIQIIFPVMNGFVNVSSLFRACVFKFFWLFFLPNIEKPVHQCKSLSMQFWQKILSKWYLIRCIIHFNFTTSDIGSHRCNY